MMEVDLDQIWKNKWSQNKMVLLNSNIITYKATDETETNKIIIFSQNLMKIT